MIRYYSIIGPREFNGYFFILSDDTGNITETGHVFLKRKDAYAELLTVARKKHYVLEYEGTLKPRCMVIYEEDADLIKDMLMPLVDSLKEWNTHDKLKSRIKSFLKSLKPASKRRKRAKT